MMADGDRPDERPAGLAPNLKAALWRHPDGTPHCAQGPLGCLICAQWRRITPRVQWDGKCRQHATSEQGKKDR